MRQRQRQRRPPETQKQAGATLRSRTAGSQHESRGSAIHKGNGNGQIKGNIKIESNGKIECKVRTDGDCCPVPQSGTGRYRFKGKGQFNYNVKGARLKCKSRRVLPFDPALRALRMNRAAARFTNATATVAAMLL